MLKFRSIQLRFSRGVVPLFPALAPFMAVGLGLGLGFAGGQSCAAAERRLEAFLRDHCHDCHADGTSEGGLDLQQLRFKLDQPQSFASWERLFDRVERREMPPPDASQPTAGERSDFVSELKTLLRDAHAAGKGTTFRRLNRREYQNTLNDLFGTHLDLVSQLPEDGRAHEFDNVGEQLNVSLVQMQSYLDAADRVLDEAIADRLEPEPSKTVRAGYAESRGADKFIGKQWLKRDDGAVVFFRRLGYPTGMLREANVRKSGFYKVRVNGYAYQSETPITFSIGSTTFERGAEHPTYGYFELPPGPPSTVELQTWIDQRYMIQVEPYGISDNYKVKNGGVENYDGPGLAIKYIEVEGPLVGQFPSRGHRLIFDGIDRFEIQPRNPKDKEKSWYQPKFEIVSDDLDADVQASLIRVATAAFRRPVTTSDVSAYIDLFHEQIDRGAEIEEALRTAVAAILCSTDFLYLRENTGWLDDFAIASRLSYFLTRTSPDETLFQLAAEGKLHGSPAVMREQTERLLDDPRFDRFVTDFTDAWLDLRSIDFTNPDQKLFPEFDPFLRFSMVEETRAFFDKLVRDNLPIGNLVKSDFAMLNRRLAEHYGIEGVTHPDLRPLALDDSSPRGGVLSQASVLKVSANGTNTSPVVRGVWVMERILGQVPPAPPPGISGVEPDIRGATTLRELLDKHRDNDSCRVCHQMIDPPGFALESFDPVGGWRERFRSLGSGDPVSRVVHGDKVRYRLGPKVDSSCELPDGKKFAGYLEFRDDLASQQDTLTRSLVTKLLTFATGREMGFSDRDEIERIVEHSRSQGYGIRDLFHLTVQSEIFRRK